MSPALLGRVRCLDPGGRDALVHKTGSSRAEGQGQVIDDMLYLHTRPFGSSTRATSQVGTFTFRLMQMGLGQVGQLVRMSARHAKAVGSISGWGTDKNQP